MKGTLRGECVLLPRSRQGSLSSFKSFLSPRGSRGLGALSAQRGFSSGVSSPPALAGSSSWGGSRVSPVKRPDCQGRAGDGIHQAGDTIRPCRGTCSPVKSHVSQQTTPTALWIPAHPLPPSHKPEEARGREKQLSPSVLPQPPLQRDSCIALPRADGLGGTAPLGGSDFTSFSPWTRITPSYPRPRTPYAFLLLPGSCCCSWGPSCWHLPNTGFLEGEAAYTGLSGGGRSWGGKAHGASHP